LEFRIMAAKDSNPLQPTGEGRQAGARDWANEISAALGGPLGFPKNAKVLFASAVLSELPITLGLGTD
jgi:hypothetical protein